MSDSQDMIAGIRAETKGLPTTWPDCQRALESRQRNERDRRIYLGYLGAEDKDAYISEMAEKWGFKEETGRIQTIIDKFVDGRKHLSAEFAVQADAIGNIKKAQIWEDGESRRAELNTQIAHLELLRADGTTMVDVEEVDTSGEKANTKIKRLALNCVLRSLKAELHKTHAEDADAMRPYVKDHRDDVVDVFRITAHPELVARMLQLNQPVETEIIDE